MTRRMVILGLGFAGEAVARRARDSGFTVIATCRDPARLPPASRPKGVELLRFDAASPAIASASHLVITAPPGECGDPALAAHAAAVAAAGALRWIGYMSTTGVYGDRGGGWVSEDTEPSPGQPRSRRRLEAEQAWRRAMPHGIALDLFRTGGIYGPGRSALDELRAGTARRVHHPGHAFSRIHRDDIAEALVAAALHPAEGTRVLHLVDDEPAEQSAVVEEAARLLGVTTPPAVPFERARATMSPMALSFWSENRRVDSTWTKQALGLSWRYPDFRSGLAAILAQQGTNGAPE